MQSDDDKPGTPEEEAAERAAAEALAAALAGGPATTGTASLDAAAAEMIRAAAGKATPLGELRARGLARAAVRSTGRAEPTRNVAPRRWGWARSGAVVTAAMLLVLGAASAMWWSSLAPRRPAVPERLCSRGAGLLVPGPFPPSQTAAERLDVVTTDRMVAMRELRVRRLGRGRR